MKPTLYPNGFPSVYDELKTFYPVFYRDVFEMDAIWRAAGGKLDEIEAGVDAAANDTFISMMDAAALSDMEAFLDIAPNKNRTLEVRRKLVASYFVGANHIGAPEMHPSRGPQKGSRGHSQCSAGADYSHHQQALRLRRTEMARNSVCKTAILFVFGGLAYFGLEVLFRGHSHWTMFVLGGFLFLILGELNEGLLEWDAPLIWQGVLGSAIVTGAELVTGMILNIWLGLGVWDYSGMPFNYKGQICLPFSILWIFVSIAAIVLDDWLRYWLFGEERPRYTLFRRGESR